MATLSDPELVELLHKYGLKATPQRLAICKYILQSEEHPTAEKVYKEIKEKYRTIGQATIYKTIALLKEIGLISELNFGNSHSRFDPNQRVHVNIICPDCNSIFDYESELLEKFWQKIVSEVGGESIGQRLDLYKTCKKCSKE